MSFWSSKFLLWATETVLYVWNFHIFEVVKLCRMKQYPPDSTFRDSSINSTSLFTLGKIHFLILVCSFRRKRISQHFSGLPWWHHYSATFSDFFWPIWIILNWFLWKFVGFQVERPWMLLNSGFLKCHTTFCRLLKIYELEKAFFKSFQTGKLGF